MGNIDPIRDGEHGEYEELANAVRNSLELAHTKGWSGVAIPAISSGIFGFPKKDCAKVMFDVALEFLAIFGNDTPLKVRVQKSWPKINLLDNTLHEF